VNNWICHFGFLMVAIAIMLLITFALFSRFAGASSDYINVIGYLVLPGVLLTGMLIVPGGMVLNYLYRRHGRRQGRETSLPRIDLNDRRTRVALSIFAVVSFFLVLPALAVSAYKGYTYTESTAFCANVCHAVMAPQATAHATSGHARVACAECHIGPGADWFVKSKLSGLRQVYAVWFDTYSRPIPPAIKHLRPARETCEHCHWPAKFFGPRYREYTHFSPDENNTARTVRMFLHVGGARDSAETIGGIHAHMVLAGQIEYIATDETLQEIPWVRYAPDDGPETVYRSDGLPAEAPRPDGLVRTVDCMDCHNRGAHHFKPPQVALDRALADGQIDPNLPHIKRHATRALTQSFSDRVTTEQSLRESLRTVYREEHPEVSRSRAAAIDDAADVLIAIYRRNFFPAMNENWSTYPENIGHLYSPGCFRCHDGRHVSSAGKAISPDCDACHTVLVPTPDDSRALRPGQFAHSMDLSLHRDLRCSQCHDGGRLLLCRDCHAEQMRRGEWTDGRFRWESTGTADDLPNDPDADAP
jgi:hypothetical protein